MAISTYTELKAEVTGFSHRTDITANMDTFSILAESVINKDLRTLEMEKRVAVLFTSAFYDLPSNFMELRSVHIGNSDQLIAVGGASTVGLGDDNKRTPIKQSSPQQLDTLYSNATGTVSGFAIHGGQIEVRPAPSVASPAIGELSYYARLPDLVTNSTNEVLVNYPMIYLSAMMLQVYLFLQDDEELQKWSAVYEGQVKMANKTSSASQYVLPQVSAA